MKILFDHQTFTDQIYGGISRYFKYIIDGIKDTEDIDYKLGVLRSNNYYIRNEHQVLRHKIYNSLFKTPQRLQIRNNSYCKYLIKKGDFSILHPTYFNPYVLKNLKRPMVLTVHDMTYEALPEMFPATDPLPYYKRVMMERADKIIAISEHTKNDILKYSNIKAEKIEVVHHGIDLAPNLYTPVEKLPENYILFVGGRWSYKNFYMLAEAYKVISKKYPDVKLVLAGGGPLAYGETEYLIRNGLTDKIQQISATDEQLNTLYRNAICFVYPSSYEGFGLPILEAFKNDCPVILNRSSCFEEIATAQSALFFEKDNLDSLIAKLDLLINDRKLASQLKEDGKKELARYTIEKCVAKTLNIYRSLI
ncbi:glycosyltransferase family 4 protein [Pedobacter nanyangensis]|uniref:glycosyltransferase family 4 protein n=1 Tax=Pedobacter nanyangensis TaxID=1562389 RepID=UPI000DE38934|nr:glycosyltransferase family 1 protein [Pedobacter nanyangensis]